VFPGGVFLGQTLLALLLIGGVVPVLTL